MKIGIAAGLLLIGVALGGGAALAQQAPATIDIDRQRGEQLEQLRAAGVPSPEAIRTAAARTFSLPVDQQSDETLRTLAREANAYANLVGRLYSSYETEWRNNARYDFVRNAMQAPFALYENLGNEFKDIRNRAYMSLGARAEARGEKLEAFFYYNDAYRLSSFACSSANDTAQTCPRLAAEERMRTLLGIQGAAPYTLWRSSR